MSGQHFPWVPCPHCGSDETYDTAPDDAPVFSFECRVCEHEWDTAGFWLTAKPTDEVEGHPV